MKKLISILIGFIVVLSLYPAPSGAADTQDEYEIPELVKYHDRPPELQDAVDEIQLMIKEGKPRWEIAKRAAVIADGRITNMNWYTYEHWTLNPLFPVLNTKEDKLFAEWRGKNIVSYGDVAKWAWNNKCGQCEENADLVYYLLKKAGAKDVRLFNTPGHRFVVWGMDEEADLNKPESWTDDVIVPDGWQHYVLRGQKAFNNEYCAKGGKNKVTDDTEHYDNVLARCGFPPKVDPDGNEFPPAPCCKKMLPCRNNPKLVCLKGNCVACGDNGQPCCEGGKCNNEKLECKDGKCVEKSKIEKAECRDITDSELRDACFEELAWKRGDPSICDNIKDSDRRYWCKAKATKDKKYCELIEDEASRLFCQYYVFPGRPE